jgi:hypothetical protein
MDLLGGTAKPRCRRGSVDETVAILAEVARSHANVKLIRTDHARKAPSAGISWAARTRRARRSPQSERQSFL